jgi:hypothetical protein
LLALLDVEDFGPGDRDPRAASLLGREVICRLCLLLVGDLVTVLEALSQLLLDLEELFLALLLSGFHLGAHDFFKLGHGVIK